MISLKDLQLKDRPRERLIECGVESLSDTELLAILIGSGTSNKDVLSLANEILKSYPLHQLKDISFDRLVQISGIKKAKACLLLSCFEVAKRAVCMTFDACFETPKQIYKAIYGDIYLESKEIIILLYVDCKLRLIKKKILRGDSTHSIGLSTKLVAKMAIETDAYGVILVHNHPSGDCLPSNADVETTYLLKQVLTQLDILLLDHLVVSPSDYYSFEEHGLFLMTEEYTKIGDFSEENNSENRIIDRHRL